MVSRRLLVIFTAFLIAVAVQSLSALPEDRGATEVSIRRSGDMRPGAGPASGGSPASADDIAKTRSEWTKDLHAKQLDQIVALYTPDAVFLKPSGERVTGRPAIRDLMKKIMDSFTSDITLHSMASDHSGDLAYDSGEYRESLVKLSDETKANVQGNYLMIFKRQPDGTWLIAEQMWTLVTPPTE